MLLNRINTHDNVAVAIEELTAGETYLVGSIAVTAAVTIPKGHKIALENIPVGANIIKYGFPIGHAIQEVAMGDWVHSHNVKTNLGDILEYQYRPVGEESKSESLPKTFKGYQRANGKVGVRNEIWVIPTVGCVNRTAQLIARGASEKFQTAKHIDGIYEFTHPYGCSQLGEDHTNTQRILADLVNHPNAAGVLVLGLGCENNYIEEFKKVLGPYDVSRVKFLVAQDVEDEVESGIKAIYELIEQTADDQRVDCPISELVVGLKCGGSDGFSGITGNPLVGEFSDKLGASGGTSVLTEVPEMFGAETILMDRAINEEVFGKIVHLVNYFKKYYEDHNQPIYENPSPGNKKGGITTLEEKSLGCTQKGGRSQVVDVLGYGDVVKNKGLTLLSAPGNDIVAATALAASGCQIILFTTGRGTPLGTAVPTMKIATNSEIFTRKSNWMDFDAGVLLEGQSMKDTAEKLLQHVIDVASGSLTKSEKMGFRDIAIFKNGVTL
ncbi:UxaA family hydrolase [Pelosinus baikalensis]|uniref:Altronate dehydratase family protein n=1 Tax=Pelosinus baikalensis TaxID=2892015 RepID=A0ABS8HUN8_9FIRM|nr:altronate dehydratase family protein [Pelosinus baikalensis]MCC5466888.1 altronate dehydratase family protein [Pelosinus baikalensis]